MTNRERLRAAFSFNKIDRIPQLEHGFWEETYQRWKDEGLPESVIPVNFSKPSQGDLFSYFDILKCGYIQPINYFIPPFEEIVLEETDECFIAQNNKGVINKQNKAGASLPQTLDYAIKNMGDYLKYRERLLPGNIDKRIWLDANIGMEEYPKQDDYAAVITHMDGFYSFPREILGAEAPLYLFYDEPEMMKLMINDHADVCLEVYSKILSKVKPDFMFIWEDMSFKNGPLISPDTFKEFLMPAYKKIISMCHDFGVKNIVVDSDGDVRKLIPLWLECGVTGALPFEVQAGMDVVNIGNDFPNLIIFGGINKLKLFGSKEDIDEELNRVLPAMAKRGGYIATLDHWVPPEIPFENFEYYVEKVRNFKL